MTVMRTRLAVAPEIGAINIDAGRTGLAVTNNGSGGQGEAGTMQMDRLARYLVIDDLGEERPWPSPRILGQLHCTGADFDPLDYIVRNLGYVLIVERPDFVRVRLRPMLVSSRTVAALYYRLAECRPRRTAISWMGETWHDEVCGDSRTLFRRLTEILHGSMRSAPPEPFIATPRSMETVLAPGGHPFAPLLRGWLKGSWHDDILAAVRAHGLWDRAMVAERDGDTGQFIFRHSGGSLLLYGSSWAEKAVGRRLADQPDPVYGKWIADGCAAVDEKKSARCELVHAAITRPDGEVQRWRYERLMLPCRTADGRHLVLTVSARDPGPGR